MAESSNPFTLVPAMARKYVYGLYGAAALAVACVDVGYGAASAADPTWLAVSQAVIAYLAVPVGVLAASNTPASAAEVAEAIQDVPPNPPNPNVP